MPRQSLFNATKNADGQSAEIRIYGGIYNSEWGGIDEKLVSKALDEIGAVANLDVRINSNGGDVYAGWAIHNLLKQHQATVRCIIDGVAASSAATIAMAGDTIVMPTNSLIMIHESSMFAYGTKTDIEKALNQLQHVDEAIVATIAKITGKSEANVRQWIIDETWFSPKQAKEAGFPIVIEGEIDVSQAATKVANSADDNWPFKQFRKTPSIAMALFARNLSGDLTVEKPNTPPANPPAPPADPTNAAPPANPPTPPTPPAAPTNVTLTEADINARVEAATKQGIANEAKRQQDIRALCKEAGCDNLADKYTADPKFDVDFVRNELFKELCKRNPAPNNSGGSGTGIDSSDPHAAFKKEYAENKAAQPTLYNSISEEQYVRSRCREEGQPLPEKKAA